MRLFDSVRKLHVTDVLRLMKNSKLQIEGTDKKFTDVTLTELARLGDVTERYEVVTAANTITAAEDGKTFFLDAAAGFASTLPAPALGLHYKFIVRTAPTSNGYDIATNGGADIMKGVVQEAETDTADDGPTDQNADNLNLAANIAVAGDWVEVVSDGTSWFFTGQTAADGGLVPSTT